MSGLIRQQPNTSPPPKEWLEPIISLNKLRSITPLSNTSRDSVPPQFTRSLSELLRDISTHRLIMSPYEVPSYSNMAFSLLGEAVLSATQMREGHFAPASYEELVKRDIFDKLDMGDSSFLVDESNKRRVVVPSYHPTEVVCHLHSPTEDSPTSDLWLLTEGWRLRCGESIWGTDVFLGGSG
jgi:CubicO group peptidase (beta-lactamase class C family)